MTLTTFLTVAAFLGCRELMKNWEKNKKNKK